MLALLCGGQGLLSADMFDLVAERPEAAAIFNEANLLLGYDPRALVRNGGDELLHANRTNQILAVTAALTIHACIADVLPSEFVATGYSVGEMAAWSIAGVWTAKAALQLTDIRARVMDAAGGSDGQLGYVRGLGREALEVLAAEHDCAIAITNPDKLFVVGGERADVAALCRAAEAAGAVRAALLAVRIASHTPRLSGAVAPFHQALKGIDIADPKRGLLLLAGGNGTHIFRSGGAIAGLAAQIATQVDWAANLEALIEAGTDEVLDLGPGHALADMVRSSFPSVRSYAVDGFRSVDGIRTWIGSAT